MNITYDDFEKQAKNDGLYDSFSKQDLELARLHPEAGMSILSYKKDYLKPGATAEQKALANEGANNVRKEYGNYTAGADGSGYYATSFYDREVDNTLKEMKNAEYNNNYSDMQKNQLDKILNREEFSYNPDNDPLYSSYKKTYLREGDRATQNTLAQAAAMTGGIPSSYAVNAAAGAGNYYAGQLADVIPTLYDKAYNKYLQEYQNDITNLGLINEMEGTEYQRFLDGYDMKQTYLNNVGNRENTEYTRKLEEAATKNTAEENNWKKAYDVTQLLGYVPEEYADIIGLPAGTVIADKEYKDKVFDFEKNITDKTTALAVFNTIGYANKYVADTLGVSEGEVPPEAVTQIFSNALAKWEMLGYADAEVAKTIGIPEGTKTSDVAFNQANIALDYYKKNGINTNALMSYINGSPAGSQTLTPEPGNGGVIDDNTGKSDAKKKFEAGDHSDEVIKALVNAGYTEEEITEAGYKGNYFKNAAWGNKTEIVDTLIAEAERMKNDGYTFADIREMIETSGASYQEKAYVMDIYRDKNENPR